ncbi:hypothetical protein AB0M39_02355 [Streptomyces sp. NPDC051907]|uniref:hypothetical protein n=1 Tax=Streptomyces sp. NPDC051907 TaxID=3155284 RepID=UPI00341F81F3
MSGASGIGGAGGGAGADKPDLAAPTGALEQIAQGIDLAHSELQDLGMLGWAVMGRGFSDLALSSMELGHGGLTEEFETFCERWEWGVRGLTQRGNGFAKALGLSAGAYAQEEKYRENTLKIGLNSLNGNPRLTEEEVKAKKWDDVKSQSPWDGADYSAESFDKANSNAEQAWRDTTYDAQHEFMDTAERVGAIDPKVREATDEKLREMIDPTDEAVQRAEQPTWGNGWGQD